MIETDAGVRWPWLGRSFAKVRYQYEQGDGDHEEEEKWWWRVKWLGLMARSLLIAAVMRGHTIFHYVAPKIMD
jgi:hypothetical protein